MLAIIMGVASFGTQKLIPLVDMHIAQHFFWIYILFAVLGAGRYALDPFIYTPGGSKPNRLSLIAIPAVLGLLAIGLYREFSPRPPVAAR